MSIEILCCGEGCSSSLGVRHSPSTSQILTTGRSGRNVISLRLPHDSSYLSFSSGHVSLLLHFPPESRPGISASHLRQVIVAPRAMHSHVTRGTVW
ncbi:hypothetical protein BD309DRAFT_961931 [Dichomitus squalens]|nr:hypothetical protein BD309DRAFT_961931 [Dichomitus squalens]